MVDFLDSTVLVFTPTFSNVILCTSESRRPSLDGEEFSCHFCCDANGFRVCGTDAKTLCIRSLFLSGLTYVKLVTRIYKNDSLFALYLFDSRIFWTQHDELVCKFCLDKTITTQFYTQECMHDADPRERERSKEWR